MSRAYITAYLQDELWIKGIRDRIWASTNAREYYKRKKPHITVIPPFDVKEEHRKEVNKLVDECRLTGREVDITTLGVYQNIHKPFVVLLYVDVQLEDVREELLDNLKPHVKRELRDPVEPHITLFKTHRSWEFNQEERKFKKKLQREILETNSYSSTEIRQVEVMFT